MSVVGCDVVVVMYVSLAVIVEMHGARTVVSDVFNNPMCIDQVQRSCHRREIGNAVGRRCEHHDLVDDVA